MGSRRLSAVERRGVQRALERAVAALNGRYRRAIAARFLVTLGDEFQGVLKQGPIIPDLIWDLEASLAGLDVRLGIGCGSLNPPFKALALGMDGPAFHAAREAVELARKRRLTGGLFRGFGPHHDVILNGLASLLRRARRELTRPQGATLDLLRQGRSQVEIAAELRLTKQAVNSRAQGAGWEAYLAGERALRAALEPYDFSDDWRSAP